MGIIISSRVKDPQGAQQLGSLIVLPLIMVMIGQIIGAVDVNYSSIVAAAVLMSIADIALLVVAVRIFRRETIFTGWK
jgi:ABC-2 type transport system permease protein